ncbi:DNA-binding protein H-NS [Alkalispirillum mobile]|uniref:DNA-binding protein H-NS n=1 Tax=Alkalispirillum mobile TaxID=85925 RepID=A0A498C4Y3_9GAMM|nr:H-NS histone family protein [Alkalispirillum mobile]RLK50845.1 DNA-binding protein H-NS [Alkalispirillum mobile]
MDLSGYSISELNKLKTDIEREVRQRRKQQAKEAQRELKAVADKYGFSLNELVGNASTGGGQKAKAKAVYQHPEDPSKTWSGRGRRPRWINEWEQQGRDIDELRVS